MTFVRQLLNTLWDATVRVVLPDPVLRIDKLDAGPEEIEHERLQQAAEGRHKKGLRATWSVEDFVADMSQALEQEHAQRGRQATLKESPAPGDTASR